MTIEAHILSKLAGLSTTFSCWSALSVAGDMKGRMAEATRLAERLSWLARVPRGQALDPRECCLSYRRREGTQPLRADTSMSLHGSCLIPCLTGYLGTRLTRRKLNLYQFRPDVAQVRLQAPVSRLFGNDGPRPARCESLWAIRPNGFSDTPSSSLNPKELAHSLRNL